MNKLNLTKGEELVIDEFMTNLKSGIITVHMCNESLNYTRKHGEFGVSRLIRANLNYLVEKYSLTRAQIDIVLKNSPLS